MDDTYMCARCKHFPLQGMTPEQRATGQGQCEVWEKPAGWNERPRPCVFYGRPQDSQERRRREAFVTNMERTHAGTEIAVDAVPGA